jgi:hypothetical protein
MAPTPLQHAYVEIVLSGKKCKLNLEVILSVNNITFTHLVPQTEKQCYLSYTVDAQKHVIKITIAAE